MLIVQNGRAPTEGTKTQPDAQTLAAMRSALYSLAYAAPEVQMAMLWEKLVEPLVRRAEAAERENARLNSENEALAAWAAGDCAEDRVNSMREALTRSGDMANEAAQTGEQGNSAAGKGQDVSRS